MMLRNVKVLGVVLAGCCFAAGYAAAQSQMQVPEETNEQIEFRLAMTLAEGKAKLFSLDPKGHTQEGKGLNELTHMYQQAASNPSLTSAAIHHVILNYNDLRAGARSAAQVSQAADEATVRLELLQAAQNQRIIQLLEQIAQKK